MSQIETRKRQKQIDQSCSWIFEAFITLLKDRPFTEISIAQIVKKAGVSRQTFYRHFKSKEDLIEWQMAQIFQQYITQLQSMEKYALREDLILYFRLSSEVAPMLKAIFDAGLESIVLQKTMQYVYQLESAFHYNSEKELLYVSEYFAGGVMMIILRWIREGMVESPEDLADLIINRCMDTSVYNERLKNIEF